MQNENPKKRILLLNYEFPPLGGGASPVSFELAKRLSETGTFQIDVVTMGYKSLPKFEQVNDCLKIYRVPCLRSKKEICHPWEQLTYLVSAYFKCKQLLRKNIYDVCHCHFIIPTGALALRLKKKFGLQYVITTHGSDVLGYNKRFKRLYPLLISSWKKILDGAEKVLSPSEFLKTEITKIYPQISSKICVIPNGIDTKKFQPQAKKKYIFSSGRLLENKGFQHLIKAVSVQDLGYEVHIAGDGPMMPVLKELAAQSKTRIIFHGWLDNRGTLYRDILERSSIYVLLSEKESFGMATAEAMSAGCAIITTNTSGAAEMTGDAGILIGPGDTAALTAALLSLIGDEAKLSDLQRKAVERVKDFSWDTLLKTYMVNI